MAELLPPGVSAETMAETLERFRQIVGKEWVFTGEQVVSYHDPYPISNDDTRYKAHAAVAPSSTEQVQEIVKAANTSGVPLWPVSRGKNFAYGGAAPVLSGSVVLDMSRMNRILEVNEKFGYALVEPGVSYFDLYNYLQAHGSETVAGRAGSGLGQRDGERAGSRRRLHALRRSLHDAVRHGGRAGERRRRADRDGRDARQQHLAVVQVRLRPVRGRHLLAVELRHRHQDGHLAHAGARRLSPVHDHLRTRRGHRAGRSRSCDRCGSTTSSRTRRPSAASCWMPRSARPRASITQVPVRYRTASRERSWPTRKSACGISAARCTGRRRSRMPCGR